MMSTLYHYQNRIFYAYVTKFHHNYLSYKTLKKVAKIPCMETSLTVQIIKVMIVLQHILFSRYIGVIASHNYLMVNVTP